MLFWDDDSDPQSLEPLEESVSFWHRSQYGIDNKIVSKKHILFNFIMLPMRCSTRRRSVSVVLMGLASAPTSVLSIAILTVRSITLRFCYIFVLIFPVIRKSVRFLVFSFCDGGTLRAVRWFYSTRATRVSRLDVFRPGCPSTILCRVLIKFQS